ncbi:hypothetical protein EGW08_011984, partial [Elysia chlorotica]
KCPSGSHEAVRCPGGSYQDETGQGDCKTCPEGFFCDSTQAPVVLFNDTICPQGYYCPNGTSYATEFPCPAGTYSNLEGLQAVSECSLCPGGYYCDGQAQTNYSTVCTAGFYCRQGATSGTPNQGEDADECPAGHYCPVQTSEPQKCPLGTFSSAKRLTDIAQCLNCTAGSYCGEMNLTAPSGPCQAGFYCPESSSLPTQVHCPAGHFCNASSSVPTPCPK